MDPRRSTRLAAAALAASLAATAVDGFPADAIRVALDDLGLEPGLVVAGVDEGQGGVVEVSGTVGAARAAARQGIPALAVSQGIGDSLDYEVAAELVVAWLDENRDALVAGELPANSVLNLDVPSCDAGGLRGILDVATHITTTEGALVPSDCTSSGRDHSDDITAFVNGFATLAEVTIEPAV